MPDFEFDITVCDVTKDTCATPDGDGKREIAYPTLSSNEICIHQDFFIHATFLPFPSRDTFTICRESDRNTLRKCVNDLR